MERERHHPPSAGRIGPGLSFSIAPVGGNTGSGTGRLWSVADASQLERGQDFEAEGRLEAEFGYGLAVPGTSGVVTPYTGVSLGEQGSRRIRLGTLWRIAPQALLGVEGVRTEHRDRDTAHTLKLLGRMRF